MTPPQPADPASAHRYELEFTLESGDMRAVVDHTWSADPTMREAWSTYHRSLRQWTWVAVAVTLGLAIFIWLRHEQIIDQGLGLLPVAWGAVAAYLWWAVSKSRASGSPPHLDAAKERFISDRGVQYCLGPQRLSASAEGLTLRTTHFDTVQRWTGIDRIDAIHSHILLIRPDGRIFIVPARAFSAPEAASRFADDCREWLAAHNAGDHQRLVRFLAGSDLPCPRCNYNLRGCRADRCPACALPLDRGTIPSAF